MAANLRRYSDKSFGPGEKNYVLKIVTSEYADISSEIGMMVWEETPC